MSWHDSAHWLAENAARIRVAKNGTWLPRAACRGIDPDVFHPSRGEDERPAKTICAKCPVVAECLEYALDSGEKFGVWGGYSERQRRQMRAARRAGQVLDIAEIARKAAEFRFVVPSPLAETPVKSTAIETPSSGRNATPERPTKPEQFMPTPKPVRRLDKRLRRMAKNSTGERSVMLLQAAELCRAAYARNTTKTLQNARTP